MIALMFFVLAALASPFKSKRRLEAENAARRHQLIILRRKVRGRVRLTNGDRWFFVQLYRWFPSVVQAPYDHSPRDAGAVASGWLSLLLAREIALTGGRPQTEIELRALIRQMSVENLLWGAPRIHGELLKLGFEVAQSTVAKYMAKRRGPRSQGWRTFLRNHAPDIAAMDLFVVPIVGFEILYGFVIVRLHRRALVWINVTTNPSAEWVARQITEAFPWDGAPRYMIRDRDRIYGTVVTRRLRAHGHSGQAHRTGLTLAERLCRTADRLDPARVFGPRHRLGRSTFAPSSEILRRLLQLRQDASVFAQGCAGFS